VIGWNRFGDEVYFVIARPNASQFQVPVWMTDPGAAAMTVRESPRVDLGALRPLRRLLDATRLSSDARSLESRGIRVSMDGKGRFLDNIFIERLWRSLKYEDVFIKAYGSVAEARQGIGDWLRFYNEERLHQALGYRTPCAVFDGEAHEPVDNASTLKGYGVAHRLVGTELKRELTYVE
jgi:transposase InsO family protein